MFCTDVINVCDVLDLWRERRAADMHEAGASTFEGSDRQSVKSVPSLARWRACGEDVSGFGCPV